MLLWWCCLHASSGCLSDAHYAIDVWTRSVCFLRLSFESVCTEWLLSLSESIPFSSCAAVHTQSQSDGNKAQSKWIGIYFSAFFTLKVLKVVLLKATFTQHFIQCIKHFLTIMRCRGWVRGGSVCWPSTMRPTGTSELLFGTRHREEHTGFTACVLYLGCYVGQHLI